MKFLPTHLWTFRHETVGEGYIIRDVVCWLPLTDQSNVTVPVHIPIEFIFSIMQSESQSIRISDTVSVESGAPLIFSFSLFFSTCALANN